MKKHTKAFLGTIVILLTLFISNSFVYSQKADRDVVAGIPVNYDEAKSGIYSLPDPLTFADGKIVKNPRQWYKKRRPQIISLFEEYQYGKVPPPPADMSFNVFDKGTPALNGTAIRKQVTVYFTKDTSDYKMDILIYLPSSAVNPVPLFLNASFSPNATVVDDPEIKAGFMRDMKGNRIPVQRKGGFGRMNIDQFLSQGIGFATVCYGEIEPDFAEGIRYGIRGHYLKEGQEYPASDEWGAISAWSWGLSRAMDYFETDPQIDSKRVALFGISRLGKTVLWTGARDQRFGMVIASCSGEGGGGPVKTHLW